MAFYGRQGVLKQFLRNAGINLQGKAGWIMNGKPSVTFGTPRQNGKRVPQKFHLSSQLNDSSSLFLAWHDK